MTSESIKDTLVRMIIMIWLWLLLVINLIFTQWYPSLAGRVNAASMAGTWLLSAVLVQIPTTRRVCLEDTCGLGFLRLAFFLLWVLGPRNQGSDNMETWSGHSAKDLIMYYGFTLARVLAFIHMSVHLSFSRDLILNWNRPFLMVWYLVKRSWSKRASDYLENNEESFAHYSLVGISFFIHKQANHNDLFKPQEDSHYSDDKKPANFKV